ncbi:glycosyltransferase [Akkermansiaceae bacterium]|nr:glycosyltransferase [Akkermansiaceae bacterium]
MPKVSIIMPAFNAEGYIEKAIASVKCQSFTDWELLVTDDCSEDGTFATVKKLTEGDPRIKLFENSCGKGPGAARNCSIQYALGKYLAFLDADDLWCPKKLEIQVARMDKENLDFTFTAFSHVDEAGEKLRAIDVPKLVTYSDLMRGNVIATATVMIRRGAFKDLHMPDFPRAQDFALWLKLLREVDAAVGLQDFLGYYRLTPNEGSRRKAFAIKYLYDIYRKQEGKTPMGSVVLILRMLVHRAAKYR